MLDSVAVAPRRDRRPHYEYDRPWLYPKQEAALFTCTDPFGEPSRYACIEGSTKAGKTAPCIAWLFEQAWVTGKPGRNYWWTAPVRSQAKIAYDRMKLGMPQGIWSAHDTDLVITLSNKARMWFKGTEKPDNLYGDDVFAAVVDEASRIREASWHAIRSTLTATRGPVRLIGNVKGRKNWFYALARRAEKGEAGMSYAKLTAWDAVAGGVLAKAEIEDARRVLPDHVFRELYLAEPADDGGNPFGLAHIEGCKGALSPEPPIAYGIDLAKSQDWTVVIGLDRFGRVCVAERWQMVPWKETIERIVDLVGTVPALADSTGVGDPVVEAIQERCSEVEGYTFSSQSKQRLMEGLSVEIQSRAITYPSGIIPLELENFEYEYTRTGVRYSAPEGFHDDCVMALALAVSCWRAHAPIAWDAIPVEVERASAFVPTAPDPAYEPDLHRSLEESYL